jgi:hypothetical protein
MTDSTVKFYIFLQHVLLYKYVQIQSNVITPRYSWNIAKGGIKYQSVNQQLQ